MKLVLKLKGRLNKIINTRTHTHTQLQGRLNKIINTHIHNYKNKIISTHTHTQLQGKLNIQ